VTQADWAHADVDTARARIERIATRASEAHFNVIFFQARGWAPDDGTTQGTTQGTTSSVPWSGLLGARNPAVESFDPLAHAIDAAHRAGLELHAAISLLPLWHGGPPAPQDPEHLYHRHGPLAGPDSSWVCSDANGRSSPATNGVYYLDPSLPPVRSHLKRIVGQLVKTYDMDGLHFNGLRYPGAGCANKVDPIGPAYGDTAAARRATGERSAAALGGLLESVVAEALLVKPHLVVSASGEIGDGSWRDEELAPGSLGGSRVDPVAWLDRGIVDFIVPSIRWDTENQSPDFHRLWEDLRRRTPNHRYIFPALRVGPERVARQINLLRRGGGIGHVLSGWPRTDLDDGVGPQPYSSRVGLPERLKRIRPRQVVGLDVSGLAPQVGGGQRARLDSLSPVRTADAQGWLNLILPQLPDTLRLSVTGHPISGLSSVAGLSVAGLSVAGLSGAYPTAAWRTPYRYRVLPDSTVVRPSPWVELRRAPADTTDESRFHFLFRTGYPARAFVNGDSVKVYSTGVFFDSLGLREGVNRVRAEVLLPDSSRALYEREFVHLPAPPRSAFPLWHESRSVEPRRDLILLADDEVRLSFRGSRGQRAVAQLKPGSLKLTFAREDHEDYSLYRADLSLRQLEKDKPHHIRITLESAADAPTRERHEFDLAATLEVRELDRFPLVRTTRPGSPLSYSLGRVRLGGPFVAEYPPGVVLRTSGRIGNAYRVRLNANEIGYITDRYVEVLPAEAVRPTYHISSLSASLADSGDTDLVRIPYPEPVPYAVVPDPDHRQILITLYGVKTSSTWVQHRSGLRFVDKLTWRQTTPETYQIAVHLKTDQIWGYDLKREGRALVLRLPHPPTVGNEDGSLPLAGLKIAIEAGHGGSSTGAVGLSGLLEKDVNLDVALKLGQMCRANGIEVFQLRVADRGIPYMARRDSAEASGAHLLVSIHANAGGTSRGYLGAEGASTYYHNPFWAGFARDVCDRLLEIGLGEFGVVGSFNYRNTRISSRPAILVEQAFATHAEDEERLASDEFRTRIAAQIYAGIVEFATGR